MEMLIPSEGHITEASGARGGVWSSACGQGSLSGVCRGRVGREGRKTRDQDEVPGGQVFSQQLQPLPRPS